MGASFSPDATGSLIPGNRYKIEFTVGNYGQKVSGVWILGEESVSYGTVEPGKFYIDYDQYNFDNLGNVIQLSIVDADGSDRTYDVEFIEYEYFSIDYTITDEEECGGIVPEFTTTQYSTTSYGPY